MNELAVRIVELAPMRVASVWAFGESPEMAAWAKLEAWARPRGLRDKPEEHRIFGFNNPNPSAGSPNYGYEFWIEVGPDAVPEGDVRVEQFGGGLYAVARCPVPQEGFDAIPETWKRLVIWQEDSKYQMGGHQWLEAHLPVETPELALLLDLYLPIAE